MEQKPAAPVHYGTGIKTLKSYMLGLFLSLVFTIIAFYVVMKHSFSNTQLYIILIVLAILQLISQVVCFLRLNATPEGRWNLMPFLFTILILLVVVIGSLWIMYNLNYYMEH